MISPGWLLAGYCTLVTLASLGGGWLLIWMRPTHTRVQVATSFVAGLMLAIALLHFLPDAMDQLHAIDQVAGWMLGGFLGMFFLQRFFHFHHHDTPEGDPEDSATTIPSPRPLRATVAITITTMTMTTRMDMTTATRPPWTTRAMATMRMANRTMPIPWPTNPPGNSPGWAPPWG
jgi:zinc transporter ZupT